jgi:hypothetical protein
VRGNFRLISPDKKPIDFSMDGFVLEDYEVLPIVEIDGLDVAVFLGAEGAGFIFDENVEAFLGDMEGHAFSF